MTLPWYVRVIKLHDDSIAYYECTCCNRQWQPYQVETHLASCDRRTRPHE